MPEVYPYYRLIYTSHAVAPVDLDALLKQAWVNNPSTGITGGLVFLDNVYFQYLEGNYESVETVFKKILVDSRHRDVKVLERRSIQKRMFKTWAMALLRWTDNTKNIYVSFSPGQALNLYETDPTTAAALFRAWAKASDRSDWITN